MKIIAGLGNPGEEYRHTLHNLGFMVLDAWAKDRGVGFRSSKFQGEVAEAVVGSEKVVLLKPTTFMNLSGRSVRAALAFYKLDIEDLLVVHDELDLPPGKMKFSQNASAGGHRGVASLIQELGSKNFDRLRLGISKPAHPNQVIDYVLSPISKGDREVFNSMVKRACEALDLYLSEGMQKAMNRVNTHG